MHLTRLLLLPSALLLVSGVMPDLKAQTSSAQTGSDRWRLTTGASWRSLGRVSFASSSHGLGFLSGLQSGPVNTPAGGFPPGLYENGFVLPDANGGVLTSNFGWNASTAVTLKQQNETFAFILTRTTSQSLTEFSNGTPTGGGFTDRLRDAGAFIRLESPPVLQFGQTSLSFDLGYSWTGTSLSQLQSSFAGILSTTTTNTLVSDTYGGVDFGVSPGLPFTGNPSGGPEIPLQPSASSTQQTVVRRAIVIDSEFNRSFGLDLQTLSLGPRLTWSTPDGRYHIGLSTGLAVNLASWRASSTETLRERGGSVLGSWTSHGSGNMLLPGFYVEASLSARLSEEWLAYLATRYDHAPRLKGNAGGSEFSLDLSGWTILGGLTYEF